MPEFWRLTIEKKNTAECVKDVLFFLSYLLNLETSFPQILSTITRKKTSAFDLEMPENSLIISINSSVANQLFEDGLEVMITEESMIARETKEHKINGIVYIVDKNNPFAQVWISFIFFDKFFLEMFFILFWCTFWIGFGFFLCIIVWYVISP